MSQVTFGSIVKKSGTYALSFVINRGLSFLLIPLYTRYLTTTDYGILELLDLTMNFVIVFAGSRLGQALFYYYFSETDEEVREQHISTSIVGSFGLGALLFVVAFFTAGLEPAGIRKPAIHRLFSTGLGFDGAYHPAGNLSVRGSCLQ